MNIPGDSIHDALYGFGRLLIPTFKKDRFGNIKWLAFFAKNYTKQRIHVTDLNGFHNCRIGNKTTKDQLQKWSKELELNLNMSRANHSLKDKRIHELMSEKYDKDQRIRELEAELENKEK
jgi:hypothetical protein